MLWNRCEQYLTIPYGGHAAYDRSLLIDLKLTGTEFLIRHTCNEVVPNTWVT
jgi:hypothetical protein